MPAFLLAVERLLDPERRASGRGRGWYTAWAAVTGALTMWLHPWQGLTLLAIVAGLVLWSRFDRRYLALALPTLGTAAPLGYYFVLSRTHSSWMAASHSNDFAHFGSWLALGLAPVVLALPGFRGRELDIQQRILRLWPVAAFAVYVALDRTWFYHALAALSLPLAILAVRGWRTYRLPLALVAATVVLVTVPGTVWMVQQLINTRGQHFFTTGEAHALAFLDSAPRPGPVLAPVMPLGQAVPGFTGRQTFVGHYYWTPNYPLRTSETDALFEGRLTRVQSTLLVRLSGAAFLASDCRPGRVDLRPLLGALVIQFWRFGCATVYEVRPPALHAQTIPASPAESGGPVS